jgi:hypothetical protein
MTVLKVKGRGRKGPGANQRDRTDESCDSLPTRDTDRAGEGDV